MEKETEICRYSNPFTDWKCPYEIWEKSKDGYCIFHEKKEDKDILKFEDGIRRILEDKVSDAYHFDGFFFPAAVMIFSNFEFKKDVSFCCAEFAGDYTCFSNAMFVGENTNFKLTTFNSKVTSFQKSCFTSKNTYFGGARFVNECNFTFAEFIGERVDFARAIFLGKILFIRTIFGAKTYFYQATLMSSCVFLEVDLENVNFSLIEADNAWLLGNEFKQLELRKEIFYGNKYFFFFKNC